MKTDSADEGKAEKMLLRKTRPWAIKENRCVVSACRQQKDTRNLTRGNWGIPLELQGCWV